MTQRTIALLTLFFVACSTSDKDSRKQNRDTTIIAKSSIVPHPIDNSNWVIYKDTINMGFVVSFKYPKHLFAEHFENGECIGKKIKMVEDGPMTTMDCCLWMDDISEGNVQPIDTLIQYDLQKLKSPAEVLKDTIDIAGVKGISVRFFDKKDKAKMVKQSVYFTKFETFFEVDNERLATADFNRFIQSLKIDK